jgi:uncharacterized OB-fold protein
MRVPFVLGLAEFDEAPGVRIPCRIWMTEQDVIDDVSIGAPLGIGFEEGPGGTWIPSFHVIREGREKG